MSRILVVGASGQIAKKVVEKLLARGENVIGLVRDRSKLSDLESDQLHIHEKDLEEDFSSAFEDVKKVIFAAGSGGNTGPDKTLLIDLWAAVRCVEYAKNAGVEKFIMVSSIGADDPESIESSIKPYLVAKHMADEHLFASGLDYTVLRPGTLTDESGSGAVTLQRPSSREAMKVSRDNVSEVLARLASGAAKPYQVAELFDGETPIEEAIA